MNRGWMLRTVAVFAVAALTLASAACYSSVGVGASVPMHGGWGAPYGGSVYVGAPVWP